MGRPVDTTKKEIVFRRFYVEKDSILKISREQGISRNTIRKYLTQNVQNRNTPVIQQTDSRLLEANELVRNGQKFLEPFFPRLEKKYEFAHEQVNSFFEGDNIVSEAKQIAQGIGITSVVDMIRLEDGMIHRLDYLISSYQINALLLAKFDNSWAVHFDHLTRSIARLNEAKLKSFSAYNSVIKDLEIRYNKRYPDMNQLRKVTIQNNQINLSKDGLR